MCVPVEGSRDRYPAVDVLASGVLEQGRPRQRHHAQARHQGTSTNSTRSPTRSRAGCSAATSNSSARGGPDELPPARGRRRVDGAHLGGQGDRSPGDLRAWVRAADRPRRRSGPWWSGSRTPARSRWPPRSRSRPGADARPRRPGGGASLPPRPGRGRRSGWEACAAGLARGCGGRFARLDRPNRPPRRRAGTLPTRDPTGRSEPRDLEDRVAATGGRRPPARWPAPGSPSPGATAGAPAPRRAAPTRCPAVGGQAARPAVLGPRTR